MNRWALMLAKLPATAQRLIARHQRISLPRQCPPDERLRRLRAAICRSAAVRAVYLTLAPAERAALQELCARRGGIRPDDLADRFGALRPWSQLADDPQPRTISERLALLGWLIPRPDAPRNPAHLLLAPELRRWLPRPLALPTRGSAPDHTHTAPAIAAASALLLAAAARPLPLRADGRLRAAAQHQLAAALAADLAEPAPLLNFTLSLLIQLGLLSAHGGVAAPSPGAASFLKLPLAERQDRLRAAWGSLPAPDSWVLALRVAPRGIDWPLLRRRLIAWAEALPSGQLVPAAGLFTALRAAFGPLADAHTHGFRSVRRVPWGERRAAEVWDVSVSGPLAWLGLLAWDTGTPAALYRPQPTVDTGPGWSYDGPGRLRVPHGAGESDLLGLAPGLSLAGSDATGATYQLDPAGLSRAAAAGRRIADARDLLRRHAGPEPEGWLAAEVWTPPAVQIVPVILVQAADPAALERAARQRTVRRRLSRRLAPGLALVAPEDAVALARALAGQGLAPQLERPDPTPAHTADDLPPGTRAALLLACAFFRRHGPANAALPPPEGVEQQLRASLPPALRAAADTALRELALPPPPPVDPTPWEPTAPPEPASVLRPVDAPQPDPRTALRQAIAAKRTVTMRYRDAAGAEAERTVRPLDLYRQGDRWYVEAHCALVNDLRTFRVDRILALDPPRAAPYSLVAPPT